MNASSTISALSPTTTKPLASSAPTPSPKHAALLRLAETNAPVEIFSLPIELDGGTKRVDLRVAPAADLAPGYVLVSFDARNRGAEAGAATDAPVAVSRPEAEELVRHLERELEQARTRLRDMAERAGATEEEYKSSNEELQSMNEELRSSSEELETSREELQSINEELTTVNLQLKHNVEELDRANSDLHSLMNATNIATVFLDRELKVIRYTSEAVAIFYLIPSDTGRPLTHLKQRIDYPGLEEDARQVLRTLTPLEREVGGGVGSWFMVRLAPYRSLEERIEGVVLTFVDITERKRAEGAVRTSEEKYRALFASIEQGFVLVEAILDAAGKVADYRYLETNPAVEGMHGLANLTGKLFSELAPGFESHWTEPADHVLRTGERARMENYNRALGRWYRVHYSAVGDPANRILGLLFEDITERKRRESDLAFLAEISQDLAKLTRIDETMNTLGAKMGAHLGLSACIFGELFGENEAQMAHLTHGWNRADVPSVVGTYHMSDFMSLELVQMWRTSQAVMIRDVFADPRTDGELYAKFGVGSFLGIPLVRNGNWQFLLCVYHSEPHDWSEEEVALVRELASRIWTRLEQARAEAALRESEAHFRALAENMPGGAAFIFDRDLRYVLADGEALHAVGFQPEAFVGKTLQEALDPTLVSLYEPALRGALAGEPFTLEHASHGRVFVSRGTPLREADGGAIHAVVVVSYDITERKQAADALEKTGEQLQVALADAEAAGRAKDHFLAVLSHELRTPLMPITLALAGLARRQDVPEPIRKAHEMIGRNVELEARFIDDMLDVTRIVRGKMEIVRKDMDLHEAVRRAVEVATSDIEAKGQRLIVTMEAAECRLSGDFARLQQVIWNLLKNASKFTPNGGLIEIRSRCPDNEHHIVEVIDTGIGLEAEATERIFNAFEQASASITSEFGGLGLGLAIAKATVEAHGGTLRASSLGPGQGATFTVNLPSTALPAAAGASV